MEYYENYVVDAPKRKVGRPKNTEEKICTRCLTESSCEWRRGPEHCYLCNSCGLQFNKLSVLLSSVKNDTKFLIATNPFPIVYQAFLLKVFHNQSQYKVLMNEIINAQFEYGDCFSIDLERYILYIDGSQFNFKLKDEE